MTPLWLLAFALAAIIALVLAILDSHVEREIVNDGEDELAHTVRWRWK
jgi:hypothetical protein